MENYTFYKVFKFNKFYKVLVGFFLYTFGYTLSQIGLSWYINTNYLPQMAGTILFFSSIGSLFSVILIGHLLDRGKVEKIISYAALISSIIMLLICFIITAAPGLLIALIAMLFIRGAIFPVFIIGFRLLCSETFGENPLLDAVAVIVLILDSVQIIIAPIIGGILENYLGIWAPLLVEVIAAVLFFCLLITYKVPALPNTIEKKVSTVKDSIRFLFTSKILLGLLLLLFSLNFTTEPLTDIIMPQIMGNELNTNSVVFGAFISCIAMGSIIGAFIYNKMKIKNVGFILIFSVIMISMSILLMAFFRSNIWMLYIAAFIQGFFTAPIDIGSILMRQKLVPMRYQGKIFSYTMVINKLGVPIGNGVAGLLLAHIGSRCSIIISGILLLFVAVFSLINEEFKHAAFSKSEM